MNISSNLLRFWPINCSFTIGILNSNPLLACKNMKGSNYKELDCKSSQMKSIVVLLISKLRRRALEFTRLPFQMLRQILLKFQYLYPKKSIQRAYRGHLSNMITIHKAKESLLTSTDLTVALNKQLESSHFHEQQNRQIGQQRYKLSHLLTSERSHIPKNKQEYQNTDAGRNLNFKKMTKLTQEKTQNIYNNQIRLKSARSQLPVPSEQMFSGKSFKRNDIYRATMSYGMSQS
ncbi:UNKNOWN [Stylonychia lemnae]|uniref:Uncharacterized protein n=1 Tax=Stylonychia lemnae TaxID=5949 RepID=A0A078A7Z5_STYLE|nr:UNKNOWN [Stylonychia lemnae]|eukprot:CDW76886.1 UNKNOWN [Stylonychia lemnae]